MINCHGRNLFSRLSIPLLVSLLVLPVAAHAARYKSIKALVWRGSSEVIGEAIYLVQHSTHCIAARLFLWTPSSSVVILSYGYDLREGETRKLFRHETSGWQVDVTERTALRFESSEEALDNLKFVARVQELAEKGDLSEFTVTVRASKMPAIRLTYEGTEEYELEPILVRLEGQGFARLLARKAPEGAVDLVREVRALVCDEADVGPYCYTSDLLSMVEAMLSRHRPSGVELVRPHLQAQELNEEVVEVRLEIVFTAEQLEFLTRFPSFDPFRPMAGTCAEAE